MFFLNLFQRHVMQKALVERVVVHFVLQSINSQNSRLVVAQFFFINGFMLTLSDMKNPCTYAKLTIKHALLTTAVNFIENKTSLKEIICNLFVEFVALLFVLNYFLYFLCQESKSQTTFCIESAMAKPSRNFCHGHH